MIALLTAAITTICSFTWVRISRKDHGHDDGAAEQRQQWHARGRPPANARVRERRTPAQPGPRAGRPRAPTRRRTQERALDSKRSARLRPPSFAGRREPPQQLRDERTSEPATHTHVRTARSATRAQRSAAPFADCHEPPTQRLPATSAARRASEPAPHTHTHTSARATGVARHESLVALFGGYLRVTKLVPRNSRAGAEEGGKRAGGARATWTHAHKDTPTSSFVSRSVCLA